MTISCFTEVCYTTRDVQLFYCSQNGCLTVSPSFVYRHCQLFDVTTVLHWSSLHYSRRSTLSLQSKSMLNCCTVVYQSTLSTIWRNGSQLLHWSSLYTSRRPSLSLQSEPMLNFFTFVRLLTLSTIWRKHSQLLHWSSVHYSWRFKSFIEPMLNCFTFVCLSTLSIIWRKDSRLLHWSCLDYSRRLSLSLQSEPMFNCFTSVCKSSLSTTWRKDSQLLHWSSLHYLRSSAPPPKPKSMLNRITSVVELFHWCVFGMNVCLVVNAWSWTSVTSRPSWLRAATALNEPERTCGRQVPAAGGRRGGLYAPPPAISRLGAPRRATSRVTSRAARRHHTKLSRLVTARASQCPPAQHSPHGQFGKAPLRCYRLLWGEIAFGFMRAYL